MVARIFIEKGIEFWIVNMDLVLSRGERWSKSLNLRVTLGEELLLLTSRN